MIDDVRAGEAMARGAWRREGVVGVLSGTLSPRSTVGAGGGKGRLWVAPRVGKRREKKKKQKAQR